MDHPWQLFLALAIVKAAPVGWRFHLVASKHKYWEKIDIELYRQRFGKIFFFQEPRRATSLKTALHFLREAFALKSALSALPIQAGDSLLTLCYYTYLENLLTSVFARNRQVYLMRDDIYQVYNIFEEKLQHGVYREAKSGILHRMFLEPLLGLKKSTRFVWINTPENFHDVVLQKRPEAYYGRVFRLRAQTAARLSLDEIYYPYSLLQKSQALKAKRKRIVFFLSDYIKNPDYYRKISAILQALARHFGTDHLLELRAHPNRSEEYAEVDAAGWQLNQEPGSGEVYLLAHRGEIACAFSHVSTVLLFATQLGIPSYTYYRLFGFAPEYQNIFDRIYRDMPPEFFMKSFEQLPEKYSLPANPEPARRSLQKLYDALA